MCPLLNEEQEKLFSFIMRYSKELQLNKINHLRDPNPFPIFFGGGVGARITKVIPEYMKKTLKSRGQNMNEHPAVAVRASTCKAATNVNEFHILWWDYLRQKIILSLTFTIVTKFAPDKKDNFQKKCESKALLVDEISMISKLNFNDLNVNMRKV